MDAQEKGLTEGIDRLIIASKAFETRLERAGYPHSHEWIFALREMLYDIRRLELLVEKLYTSETGDLDNELRTVVEAVLYEMLPHIESHMREIENDLNPDEE